MSSLDAEFVWDATGVFLRQIGYAKEVLRRFGLQSCKPVSTSMLSLRDWKTDGDPQVSYNEETKYQQAVGALLCILTSTMPYIAVAVGIMGNQGSQPTVGDWSSVKRIMRYLSGTPELGLRIDMSSNTRLTFVVAYSDSDWTF